MKKTIGRVAAALLTGALPVAAATFPLEWNATYDTSVPREVEILPAKLAGMGLMREGDGFKVLADGQPLAVKALNGKEPGSVRLRFTVPSGTKALTCETGPDGAKAGDSDGGLFAGALAGTSGWRFTGGTVKKTEKGILLKGEKERSYAMFEVPVPDALAGKGVVQEIEVTSRAKLVWGGVVKVEQLDGDGNVLPETLCDVRWTSHMRPPDKTTLYVDEGHVHPRAKRLRASFELRALKASFDDYGRPITDNSVLLPSLEVSRLEVRAAEPLPFPKWNDDFFVPGVSGRAGRRRAPAGRRRTSSGTSATARSPPATAPSRRGSVPMTAPIPDGCARRTHRLTGKAAILAASYRSSSSTKAFARAC